MADRVDQQGVATEDNNFVIEKCEMKNEKLSYQREGK